MATLYFDQIEGVELICNSHGQTFLSTYIIVYKNINFHKYPQFINNKLVNFNYHQFLGSFISIWNLNCFILLFIIRIYADRGVDQRQFQLTRTFLWFFETKRKETIQGSK